MPGFVEKNQACRIPGRRGGVPHDPRGRDVRSIVFGGRTVFFGELYINLDRRIAF